VIPDDRYFALRRKPIGSPLQEFVEDCRFTCIGFANIPLLDELMSLHLKPLCCLLAGSSHGMAFLRSNWMITFNPGAISDWSISWISWTLETSRLLSPAMKMKILFVAKTAPPYF
jgi:hypothetical protein